jgi:hypothetical protein
VRHRGVERISEGDLIEALSRAPADQYVIWTGEGCGAQPGSLRSRALACIHEVGVPVLLRVVLQRAARLEGDLGLNPDAVRGAVYMHQIARPAVYLLVRRRLSAEYVAVTDIPFPAGGRRIVAGEVIVDRHGLLAERCGAAVRPHGLDARTAGGPVMRQGLN